MKKIVTIRVPDATLRTFKHNVAQNNYVNGTNVSLSDVAIALASFVADSVSEEKMVSFKAWTKAQPMEDRAPVTLSVNSDAQEELKEVAKSIKVPVLAYYWFGMRYYETINFNKDMKAIENIHKLAEEFK